MRQDFTLVEMLVVIVLLVVVLGAFMNSCSSVLIDNTNVVESNAQAWARNMNIEPSGINCNRRDSDGDGYYSCQVSYQDNQNLLQVVAIECTGGGLVDIYQDCRVPKLNLKYR